MPDRTSLTMLLHGLDASTSYWDNSPISVTDIIAQAYKVELFSSTLFVLFLSS